MPERTNDLRSIQNRLRAFNHAREWHRYHSPRNLAMALSVEAAELLELYLWASDEGPQPPVSSRQEKVAQEVADIGICLLNFCERSGVDLLAAISEKIDSNAIRYPVDRSRGRLEKSNELLGL